jgi:hypothetical protein
MTIFKDLAPLVRVGTLNPKTEPSRAENKLPIVGLFEFRGSSSVSVILYFKIRVRFLVPMVYIPKFNIVVLTLFASID